jgi:TPR repeat protein
MYFRIKLMCLTLLFAVSLVAASDNAIALITTEEEGSDPLMEGIKPSAAEGDADAQCLLAKIYAEGDGLDQDLAQAAKLYRMAADQGHDSAQLKLGYCYQDGLGVPRNETKAYVWFSLSADNGGALNGRGPAGELQIKIRKHLTPSQLAEAKSEVIQLRKEIYLCVKANYTQIINELDADGWIVEMNTLPDGTHKAIAKKDGKTAQASASNWRVAFNALKRQCNEWSR